MSERRHHSARRLKRIVSGGQTGVDRAALDAARDAGMPAGGWCPAGRRAEDGRIADRYPLEETASPRYEVRTKRNVRESDGTLILNEGELAGGTKLTAEYAASRQKPFLVVQLDLHDATPARVADWLEAHGIGVLNVAGPRESKAPGIYGRSRDFLRRLLHLLEKRSRRERFDRITTFLRGLFPKEYHERIYLVGGSVRDYLLGSEIRDIDLTAALPEKLLSAAGFRPVAAKSSAPIWFRYELGFGKIEVTLLGHVGALEDDLRRRDFTVNAMAMDLTGTIRDPLGGRSDLRRRRLRACSEESFVADPVRIFRAFRFECDGWRLDRPAERLIASRGWGDLLAPIPVERFSREMLDALGRKEPGRFFQRMTAFGVGCGFLPELFRMAEIPAGPAEYHPEGDTHTHALEVLERVAATTDDVAARFCALFHDLGKLATAPELYPHHYGHDEAGGAIAKAFCDRLRLSVRLRNALAGTCRLHTHVNRWEGLRDVTKLRVAEQAVRNGIESILPLVSAADKPGGAGVPGWEEALEVAGMGAAELGVAPDRLDALAPDARAGFLLQRRIERFRARTAQRSSGDGTQF